MALKGETQAQKDSEIELKDNNGEEIISLPGISPDSQVVIEEILPEKASSPLDP